jgi:transposase-like protein
VSHDDVLHRFRLRLFALARELGNVRAACRAMGVHHSTFYRWRRHTLTWGLEALRPRERRRPRMPNQLPPHVEHRVLAFCLAYPGHGPRRVAAELARERWGGLRISPNGVYKCLRRHGLSTRKDRLALVAGYAAPPEPARAPEPKWHLDAPHPGSLVGMDCFYVGRLSGTKGTVWQYTAISSPESLKRPTGYDLRFGYRGRHGNLLTRCRRAESNLTYTGTSSRGTRPRSLPHGAIGSPGRS